MKKMKTKSKIIWVGVLLLAVIAFFLIPKESQVPQYETTIAKREAVLQTVDATGKLESSKGVSLRFQASGNIGSIKIKEGETVKSGQLLGSLSLPELDATIAQAQASLNQKLAGATIEQVEVSQKQLDSARISLEKAENSLIDVTKLGEENLKSMNYSLEKAEKNLVDVTRLGEENLKSRYNSAVVTLDDANIKIYNVYTLIDSVKNNYFNGPDQQGLRVKSILSNNLVKARDGAREIASLAGGSDFSTLDNSIVGMIGHLDTVLSSLTEIRELCDVHTYKNTVPDTIRTSIDSQKTVISGAKNAIVGLSNEISVLKIQNENSLNTARNAIDSLKNEISVLKTQNENGINNAKAAIDTAKANVSIQEANLNSVKASPREVDIAYSRAVLEQARANKAKAFLYSPVDGVVSKLNKKTGELVGPADVVMEIISPHQEVIIDVSETDVVKLNLGDEAMITYDALGSDQKFRGRVITIEPSSTDIQGVVYYKVKVDLEEEDSRIKTGMTANVLIETERRDGVISIPNRAVITKDGKKYVRCLDSEKNLIEKEVVLGVRGDGGIIEVVSGLNEGEEVVLKILDK